MATEKSVCRCVCLPLFLLPLDFCMDHLLPLLTLDIPFLSCFSFSGGFWCFGCVDAFGWHLIPCGCLSSISIVRTRLDPPRAHEMCCVGD